MRAVRVVPRAFFGLLALFVLLSAPAPAIAQALPSLTIGEASGAPGSSVAVPTGLNTDGTVSVAQVDILFDPGLLSLTSVTAGGALTPNHSLDTALIAPGRQRVVITTANAALLGSGTLVSLAFTIDTAAPAGSVPLTWDGVVLGDTDGVAIAPTSLASGAVTVTGGTPPAPGAEPQPIPTLPLLATLLLILLLVFTVRRRLPVASIAVALCTGLLLYSGAPQAQPLRGDANADGVVNADDILVIVDQILGRGMAPGNADCNDDGVVNVLDTVCSAREIVPGTTAPQLIPPGNRSIPVNVPFAMSLFALDPDPGETLTFTRESGPAGIQVNAQSGALSWTPGNENLGANTVTVRVTDSTAQFDTASFTITVTEGPPLQPTNSPPQLMVPENQITRIGTPLALQASASDPDPGDSVTFSLVNAPAGMTIDPQTGSLGWTPGAGQTGLADVVVQATDTRDAAAFGTFTVDAREINRAPVARDEVYEARLGVPLNVAAAGVLANDSDPDGDPLSARLVSTAGKGELSLHADGSFDYLLQPPDRTTPVELEKRCSNAFADGGRYYGEGTVAIGDVDNDGELEIVGTRVLKSFTFKPEVWVMSAVDCSEKYETGSVVEDAGAVYPGSHLGLHDIDGDGDLEIIGLRERYPLDSPENGTFDRTHLIAINHDGTLAWPGDGGSEDSPQLQNNLDAKMIDSGPTFADINGDGTVEIIMGFHIGINFGVYSGVVVYNAEDGSLLWDYLSETRQGAGNQPRMPYVVDLDLDGTMEIIIHNNVLDHNGQLEFILPSREAQGTQTPGHLTLGIANFDDDPYPELIGRDEFHHYLFEHDGTIKWQQDVRNAARGQISVADFDGDGEPEFAYVTCLVGNPDPSNCARFYLAVFDTDGSVLWSHQDAPQYHLDGFWRGSTNITAFDANRDGAFDLVFRNDDRSVLKIFIFSGRDGSELASVPSATSTNYAQRFTAVVDLDGDGHAEIINSGWFAGDSATDIWTGTAENPLPAGPRQRHQWNFQEAYVEDDAVIPTNPLPHWLQPGRNGYHLITPEPDPLIGTTDTFTYVASDGALDSAPATVTLDILPAGNPPRFLSVPETQTTRGFSYRYAPVVVDPDLGDSVTFQLTAGPTGMTIDPISGQLDWYPQVNGEYEVSILALDTIGFATPQSFTLEVGDPVLVPDVVGLTEPAAGNALTAANLQPGAKRFRSDPAVPSGQVLAQDPPAGSVANFGAAVRLTISSGAGPADTDADGDGFTPNQGDCDDSDASVYPGAPEIDGDGIDQNCNGIDGDKTLVDLIVEPGAATVLVGETVRLTATGIFEDGSAANLSQIVTWSSGSASVTADAADVVSITASREGITGSATLTAVARIAGDDVPPVALIAAPSANGTVTEPVDVRGTATDANLLNFELAYAIAGSDQFTTIGSGTSPVTDNVLGRLDPTQLINDLYTLRLSVWDRGGNLSVDEVTVQLDEDFKVGNFALRFTDVAVPMAGIPVTVTRAYDSREKRSGDFGVGWFLDVNTPRLRANRVLGTGWQVVRSGLSFALIPTDAHLVSLTLADGRVERFAMVVSPNVSPIVPFPPLTQSVSYVPLGTTLGELRSLEDNNVSILESQPGEISLTVDSTGRLYDPELFRYLAADGSEIDIHRSHGVQRIRDPNGNMLSFTPEGIIHSGGKSVVFQRDAYGRITRVTDPAGHAQTYGYDANGDLRRHTDRDGNTTRFDYDRNHGLIRIIDPLDRSQLRNEYDDNGRLVRTTDTNGRVIEYAFDATGRQEQITDADGITRREYDSRGNPIRVTDALGRVTLNSFDPQGNLLSTTNPAGETSSRTYDGRSNLLTVTDPLGHITRYAYDGADRRIAMTDARGHVTSYSYDSRGNRTGTVDPLGNRESRFYDNRGNLIAVRDKAGNHTQHEYDGAGNRVGSTDARGFRETFGFNANGVMVEHIDRRGVRTRLEVDGNGQTISSEDGLGNVTQYQYDALGWRTARTDALGHTSATQVDAAGRPLVRTDRSGNTSVAAYDRKGSLEAATDQLGRTQSWEYDALGRLTTATDVLGNLSTTQYDLAGRPALLTDAKGNTTEQVHDSAGRLVSVRDAAGGESRLEYDQVGNRVAVTTPSGETFRSIYDAMNRPVRTEFPDGTAESRAYDSLGRLISETDALGRSTSFAYDESGNLIRITDALGGETVYGYDAEGNRTSLTDANGNTTIFTYDQLGREIAKVYPDGSSEEHAYDAVGNLVAATDASGLTTEFQYDANQRLVRKDLPDGEFVTYEYLPTHRLARTSSPANGDTQYTHDALGRLSRVINPDGSELAYAYDAVGNLLSTAAKTAANASPRTVSRTYDALNRLTSVIDPDGRRTEHHHDGNGNLIRTDYPNGTSTVYSYDPLYRLTGVEHFRGGESFDRISYTLDAVGDRVRVEYPGSVALELSYDALRRLVRERELSVGAVVRDLSYVYDAVGNRLRLADAISGTSQEYRYDSADKLLSAGQVIFGYDPRGNLVSRSGGGRNLEYAYDAENRMTGVSGAISASYAYDDLGNLVSRSTPGSLTRYLVDQNNNTSFSQVVNEYSATGESMVEYLFSDHLVSQSSGGDYSIYHRDGLNSTRSLSNSAGAVTDRYTYSATGGILSASGATDNVHLFAGERLDLGLDLYHLRARYLDVRLGRFVSRDPFDGIAREPVSTHKYLYANANPANFIDPSGEYTLAGFAVRSAIVGTVALGAFKAAVIAREAALRGYVAFSGVNPAAVPALSADPIALREAAKIIEWFHEWYDLVEPELQSATSLGGVGSLSGRTLACGAHAGELAAFINTQRRGFAIEKFKFKSFNEHYFVAAYSGRSQNNVKHTYLVAHWEEEDVYINLDSWKYRDLAPRIQYSGPDEFWTSDSPEAFAARDTPVYVSPGGRSCPAPVIP